MAKKRSNPIEDPPTASSSEEEEDPEEEEEDPEEQEEGSSSEEEDPEEEEEEVKTQTTPQTQKTPLPKKPVNSAGAADAVESDESETDSDTDSSSSNIKPIATKPMEETSNAKKSRSKAMASSVNNAASGAKRPSESEQEPKEVKRPKKKAEEEGTRPAPAGEEAKKAGEDTKKQLFQRLFSEDDEIALLKGMLDYYVKKETDPCTDMNAFYDYVKKSIHTDVTKVQLMDKIRRLKKKFENSVKGKKGEDKTFNKPHEQKAFDLSKKIWGKEGFTGKVESSAVKSNGKAKKKNSALKEELLSSPEKKVGIGEPIDVDKKGSNCRSILFDKRFGVAGLEEEVLKHGLEMVGGQKRAAMEGKWRKLQVAELELFLQRTDLVKEQAEILLEFYKSEDK